MQLADQFRAFGAGMSLKVCAAATCLPNCNQHRLLLSAAFSSSSSS